MKNKFCIFYLFLLQGVLLIAQAPDLQWSKTFGGSSFDNAWRITKSGDGNFYIGGYIESVDGDIEENNGVIDYWIIKNDEGGDLLWVKNFGGTSVDILTTILATNDSGFIAGGYTYSNDGDVSGNHGSTDYWVIKVDAEGNLQWQRTYGGSSTDILRSINITSDEGYILTGDARSDDGDISEHHGTTDESDYWIVKIDSEGEIEWEHSYGGTDDDEPKSMLVLSNGDLVVSGWSKSNDDDISFNHGDRDVWVLKLDAYGNILWEKSYGSNGDDYCYSSVCTNANNLIFSGSTDSNNGDVTGYHGGFYDVWVFMTDSVGNLEWSKTYGGNDEEQSFDIVRTVDSNFIFTGYSFSSDDDVLINYGEDDAWVVKIDSLGNLIWQLSLGGTDRDQLYSIIEADEDTYMLAGATLSTDGDITINQGETDFWVVRIGPPCTPLLFYADADSDGYGNILSDSLTCFMPIGFVSDSTDCNDANNLIHPFAEDICNSIDDNCNGAIDEDAVFILQYADADGDGFGDILNDSTSCFEITGYVIDNTDCNDTVALINPSAIENCNLLDDNCNALIDEGLILYTFYADADGDNYGDADVTFISCFEDVPGYISDSTDCDDTNNLIYPGAEELCNYLDDDCDGIIDDNLSYIYSYQDADGDDFGNIEIDSLACTIPEGFVEDDSDCDDTNPAIYPGAEETLNGIDDNCNELIDEGLAIENTLLTEIKIYPNPAIDILQIDYSGNETCAIQILNIAGENIYSDKLTAHLTINIQYLPKGIYLLKIVSTENQGAFNFVKE